MHHVFIDFENVHTFDQGIVGAESVSLTLLIGAKQTKLDAALVGKFLDHAHSVQLVRLSSSGRNALDFTLAYYVGRAAVLDPGGSFHIISGDKGFDPLIEHLTSRNINASRHEDISTLPIPGLQLTRPPAPQPPKPRMRARTPKPDKPEAPLKSRAGLAKQEDRMAAVLELLNKAPGNRPKKSNKLVSYLVAHLGKASNEAEVKALIEELKATGHLTIDEKGAIIYRAAGE